MHFLGFDWDFGIPGGIENLSSPRIIRLLLPAIDHWVLSGKPGGFENTYILVTPAALKINTRPTVSPLAALKSMHSGGFEISGLGRRRLGL